MKKELAICTLFAFSSMTATVLAHGPTPIKIEETVHLQAAQADVWKLVKDFNGLAAWHPEVNRCVGNGGPAAGAERTLTLQNGEQLVEILDDYNEAETRYAYRSAKENVRALPVSSYSVRFTVKAGANGGTDVEWVGRVYRGDTGNQPPDNLNDEAAKNAMSRFFRAGLEKLKSKLGG
jgi:mxaD protein